MKVGLINNFNLKSIGTSPNVFQAQATSPQCKSNMQSNVLSVYNTPLTQDCFDNVNFGKKPPNLNPFKGLVISFLDRDNIISAYSGRRTITKRTFETYLAPDDILGATGRRVLNILGGKTGVNGLPPVNFASYMYDSEKEVFESMARVSKERPLATLTEICSKLAEESLPVLEAKQLNVLHAMEQVVEKMTGKDKIVVENSLSKARAIIDKHDVTQHFCKKPFIGELIRLKARAKEPEKIASLVEIAKKLPDSKTDKDAFIVKYSRRDSAEIARRLVSPSIATYEHVIVRSKGGQRCSANGLVVSERDNQDRGTKTLVERMVEIPNLRDYIQSYIDQVIFIINKEKLESTYPATIAETLKSESGGIIRLDVSRLKKHEVKKKANQQPMTTHKPHKKIVKQIRKIKRKLTNKDWKKIYRKVEKRKQMEISTGT